MSTDKGIEEMEKQRGRRGKIRRGRLETETAHIYYEILGEGAPLVMLHGNGESHRIFVKYVRLMARRCQVILMDSRGHGRSKLKAGAETEFTIEDMAGDVRQLLDHLGLDRAALLGFSDGANIALEFAAQYPERATAVAAVSGNARPTGMFLPYYLMVAAQYGAARAGEALCRNEKRRAAFKRSRMLNSLMLTSPRLTAEKLKKITAPVLIMAGTRDVIKVSHTRWMAEKIPACRLELLPGGRHEDFILKPERYMGVIERFITAHVCSQDDKNI